MNAEKLAEFMANELVRNGMALHPNPESFKWLTWDKYDEWRRGAAILVAQGILDLLDAPQPLLVEVSHE